MTVPARHALPGSAGRVSVQRATRIALPAPTVLE
jgi:hypothetical protein